MNTMKNFDLNSLQYYFDNMISFKCADILKWCTTNLDNSDFDIYYAANDIHKHYFAIKKTPSMRAFYYIQQNIFHNTMYKLIRDPVMSPVGENTSRGKSSGYIKDLITAINKQYNIINTLKSKNLLLQSDLDSISFIEDVFHRRLYSITESVEINLNDYYKYTQYQKSQIYFIHKNKLDDLSTLVYMIQCCNNK